MTDNAGTIIDGLGTDFPQHAQQVSSLDQTLGDILGAVFRGGEFVDTFYEADADAVLVEVSFASQPLVLTIPGLSSFSVSVGEAGEFELEVTVILDQTGARFLLFDAPIFVQCLSPDLLTPVVKNGDKWEPDVDPSGAVKKASIVFSGVSLEVDSSGHVEFTADLSVDLPPVMLGKSGVVVEMKGLRPCLSDGAQLPDGVPAGSRGFAVDSVEVYLPESIKGDFVPGEIVGEGLFVGSGGFTGKLSAEWADGKPIRLGGIECMLKSLMFEFKQNSLVGSGLSCEMTLPFFERPVNLDVSVSGDGSLFASLSASQPKGVDYDGGLISFEKQGVFRATIEGVSFGLQHGVSTLSVSGSLQPTFPLKGGQAGEWPTFRLRELSIDSEGHVKFDGGWMDLPEHFGLDFHGFQVNITRIGFGRTEKGDGKWFGCSGGIKLVDGFTAGASVKGLRLTWFNDGRDPKVSLDGVGVEFEVSDVLYFKGDVEYRELEVNGEAVRRFDGDIKLRLISLGLQIDGKLVIGSVSSAQGNYNFFAIYVGVELPTGIPLGSLPIALYGIAGLFALQMAPNKLSSEAWYDDGWYKRPDEGVIDLDKKWVNRRNSMAFGVGVTLGLQPKDFIFSCKALLVMVFPGPTILIQGKAVIAKERAKLDDDPLFRSLAVYDAREGQILFGLSAKYKQDEQQGRIVAISADTEAFFETPKKWHLYIGQQQPLAKRVRAQVFRFLEANSYFMLDPQRLAMGVWLGYARSWSFGPVGVALAAWIAGDAVISLKPMQFKGRLGLHGSVEVSLFGFSLGLSVDAVFEADVFEPYHIVAGFEFSINLPRPLRNKSKHVTVKLEWGPKRDWPKHFTLPLKEVSVGHFKVTTTWPLRKGSAPPQGSAPPLLGPPYDWEVEGMRGDAGPQSAGATTPNALYVVPLDGRINLGFGTSVNDDARVGVNPQPVQPAFERLGNPELNEGPVRVRYGLKLLVLSKWDAQVNNWRAVAVAGRPPAADERTLYGAWVAVPKAPAAAGTTPVANDRLIVSSKSGFDYTRHGGDAAAEWFTENFPDYSCVPQEIPDREVCCDFERLERSERLTPPWRSPEHPEITLSWQARVQLRVSYLILKVKGFTRALCVPANAPASLPAPVIVPAPIGFRTQQVSVTPLLPVTPVERAGLAQATPAAQLTINLSAPAKRVRVWFVEPKQAESVCLDFRRRTRSDVKLPLSEQGVTISLIVNFPVNAATTIEPVRTTLGDMMGLNCFVPTSGNVRSVAPLNLTLPCAANVVELMLTKMSSPADSKPATVEAYTAAGDRVVKTLLNPSKQPEVVRFEGQGINRVVISTGGNKLYLHRLCFYCPDTTPAVTATGFDTEGRATKSFAGEGDMVEVSGSNLTRVQLNGKVEICLLKICALFGPDPNELAERAEMAERRKRGAERWKEVDDLFEPFSTYRLQIDTTIDAYGEGELSGEKHLTQTEYAYFSTEGPPGKTKLSLPAGRKPEEADKFESGLEDLTRYVRQTTPPTVPAVGEKPVMAKPFYRAFDVGFESDVNYLDLMYRMSGCDLGLYLYDVNGRPARDPEGRLLTQSGEWKKADAPTLTSGERRWLALFKTASCPQPSISEKDVPPDRKLTSAVAGRVLEPDTIYEARLTPLLLREGFTGYAVGAAAQGPSGRLGRWQVRDDGGVNAPSNWAAGGDMTQTSQIKGGAADPSTPGTMLLYGNDPSLAPAHQEQPANWTDYRLSVRLRASAAGAFGVVFRYRDGGNYYRFSMDRAGQYRRLVSVAGGAHSVLAHDGFVYETQREYLITVEAVGDSLRVYQDGAPVFDVSDAAHARGGVGLYCHDNPGARFADVSVDDFRQEAPVVYRFQFTTSHYANFFQHLHSYQDETWRVEASGASGVRAALNKTLTKAAGPTAPPTEDESRAYETLATAVLGQAARKNPPEVQVTRVEVDGEPLAFLVQSPEPFDWPRTDISLARAVCTRTEPALPGAVKLAAVNFGVNKAQVALVVAVLREPTNLTGYRIESRLVAWPLSPESGVVLGTQTLPPDGIVADWTTYSAFEPGSTLPAGTVLKVSPGSSPLPSATLPVAWLPVGLDAGSVERSQRIFFSVELRVVAPTGKVVHARHFLPDGNYIPEDVKVLRKADGTGFFMVKPGEDFSGLPFSRAQYRLKLTYHRDNRARVPTSTVWSQAGNSDDEIVTLDIPLQTQQ